MGTSASSSAARLLPPPERARMKIRKRGREQRIDQQVEHVGDAREGGLRPAETMSVVDVSPVLKNTRAAASRYQGRRPAGPVEPDAEHDHRPRWSSPIAAQVYRWLPGKA